MREPLGTGPNLQECLCSPTCPRYWVLKVIFRRLKILEAMYRGENKFCNTKKLKFLQMPCF